VNPGDADIVVKDVNDDVVIPEEYGLYKLSSGIYTYIISKEGFMTKEDTFIVGEESVTVTVDLEEDLGI
jgi:hypothetical protein